MRYHKTHLTRRLILETSADSEKEENMVEWLRDVGMPAEYVNKLARMFQDIKVSEDLNQEFKDTNRGSHVAGEGGREGGRGVALLINANR
jgi:cullin-5